MSVISPEIKVEANVGDRDSWQASISKKAKAKSVFSRENISLIPVQIIIEQIGTNYYPPTKKRKKKA